MSRQQDEGRPASAATLGGVAASRSNSQRAGVRRLLPRVAAHDAKIQSGDVMGFFAYATTSPEDNHRATW